MADEPPLAGSAWAAHTVDALWQLSEHGRALCPPDTDPEQWSGAVLYELARAAELLGTAVSAVAGAPNETAGTNAHALATVIAADRNNILRRHDGPDGTDA